MSFKAANGPAYEIGKGRVIEKEMIKAILKFGVVLFLICLIASLLLSVTYFVTNPRIIQQKEKEEREAFLNVLPAATKGFDPVKTGQQIYKQCHNQKILPP